VGEASSLDDRGKMPLPQKTTSLCAIPPLEKGPGGFLIPAGFND